MRLPAALCGCRRWRLLGTALLLFAVVTVVYALLFRLADSVITSLR